MPLTVHSLACSRAFDHIKCLSWIRLSGFYHHELKVPGEVRHMQVNTNWANLIADKERVWYGWKARFTGGVEQVNILCKAAWRELLLKIVIKWSAWINVFGCFRWHYGHFIWMWGIISSLIKKSDKQVYSLENLRCCGWTVFLVGSLL